MLYFNESNSFFEFSAIDSMQYHEFALDITEGGFWDGIFNYLKNEDVEDFGAVLFTSLAYIIYPSPITFNIFNVLAGMITVIYAYKLSKNFMSKEYAFMASTVYGLSSFVIYLYSTGMKETFFAMFVVLFFEKLNKFLNTKKVINLFLCLLYLSVVYFFRPAVMFMLIASVLLAILFSYRKNVLNILVSGAIVFFSISFLLKDFQALTDRYYTNEDAIAERVSGAGVTTDAFSYVAAFLSGTIGPLPTYSPLKGRLQQYFYSFGLGLKVFISIFFWLGLYMVFKNKNITLISICTFVLFETISLSAILQSFELRFSSPHLILIYIISFYWLYKKRERDKIKIFERKIISLYFIMSALMIIYWNSRLF
ncbi:hypothetical protein [Pseudotenacibaculum haliotis]|uniref:Glycosyltransferase RgtA/B/C/D-like domain-containing protein n=1 Tax=Pseudotenacibaculum haliotis TaxID=1862138 RepID=A0ABW5LTI2_9FLAO